MYVHVNWVVDFRYYYSVYEIGRKDVYRLSHQNTLNFFQMLQLGNMNHCEYFILFQGADWEAQQKIVYFIPLFASNFDLLVRHFNLSIIPLPLYFLVVMHLSQRLSMAIHEILDALVDIFIGSIYCFGKWWHLNSTSQLCSKTQPCSYFSLNILPDFWVDDSRSFEQAIHVISFTILLWQNYKGNILVITNCCSVFF